MTLSLKVDDNRPKSLPPTGSNAVDLNSGKFHANLVYKIRFLLFSANSIKPDIRLTVFFSKSLKMSDFLARVEVSDEDDDSDEDDNDYGDDDDFPLEEVSTAPKSHGKVPLGTFLSNLHQFLR